MSNIIKISKQERENGKTQDSKKYNKDCCDFQNLQDGSVLGEYKYCEFSTQCRQIDILSNGDTVGMESHFLPIFDAQGNIISHELFCTGMHDLRPYKEKLEDDKVS